MFPIRYLCSLLTKFFCIRKPMQYQANSHRSQNCAIKSVPDVLYDAELHEIGVSAAEVGHDQQTSP